MDQSGSSREREFWFSQTENRQGGKLGDNSEGFILEGGET